MLKSGATGAAASVEPIFPDRGVHGAIYFFSDAKTSIVLQSAVMPYTAADLYVEQCSFLAGLEGSGKLAAYYFVVRRRCGSSIGDS